MNTLAIEVPLLHANDAKKYLLENNILDFTRKSKRTEKTIIFAITAKLPKDVDFEYSYISIDLAARIKKISFQDKLKEFLNPDELELVKTAYDIVGTIAVLEIDSVLRKQEKKIAQALLETNLNLKTVVRKDGSHAGIFRTQKMKYLAGEKTKTTIHKENNIALELNVEEVYFSARLSTERKRIANLVKPNENILVMFSGCAPYPCVLSKQTDAKEIYGIEINPKGHEFGLKNIARNKLTNVTLFNGDVRVEVPKLKKIISEFDRILMPLPKSAEEFLDVALTVAKKGTMIHFYDFLHIDNFSEAHDKIKKGCDDAGLKFKIIDTIKCGQHAPYIYRICVDVQIK